MNKKILSAFLALTMLLSSLSFVSVFAAAEVLATYSFESDSDWVFWNTKEPSVNTISDAKATDGKHSLFVNDTVDDQAGGFQSKDVFPATPGEVYSVTFDVCSEQAGHNLYLRFYGADKKTKIEDGRSSPKASKKWESLSITHTAPEGTQYMRVLVATNAKGKGVAYYDNIKLIKGEVAAPSTPAQSGGSQGSSSTQAPSVDISAEGSKYQTEIGFLGKVGLLDGTFKHEAQITKAEMTKMVAKLMHRDMDFSLSLGTEPVFADVPSTHAYYSYIKACRDLEIVKGDFENNFYPDNQLTAIEAMTMVINALGYTPYAQALGGYPTGYYSVASQTGISKGVNIASTEPATGEVAAKILYNALFADLVELQGITSGSIELEIKTGKNILSERLGIYEYDAIVTDNGICSLSGITMGNTDRAVIKESKSGKIISAYVCDTDITSYLGYRVKAFIKNNEELGRNEFIYVAPHKTSEVVELNAKYIINPTSSYIEYDEDETTLDSEKIEYNQGNLTIIVNGVAVSGYTLSEVLPTDGFVSFIENNGDSEYDVANIISFNYKNENYKDSARNIVVDSVDKTAGEESISCSFNPGASVDLDEDVATYSFAKNSQIKSLAEIKERDIVSVGEAPIKVNGKKHYILAVKRENKADTLSGSTEKSILLSDGIEYDISSSLTGVKAKFANYLSMGKGITVYFDITGKIAYAESEGGNSKNYAYLVKAVKRSQASEYVLAKIFTKEGEMKELKLSSKVRIDGVQKTTAKEQFEALSARYQSDDLKPLEDNDAVSDGYQDIEHMGRPVIVDINQDNEITRIDTDTPNPNLNSGDISKFYQTQSLIQYSDEDANSADTLKAGLRSPRIKAVIGKNKNIEGKFYITNDTLVIAVPEIDTYGIKTEVYNALVSLPVTVQAPAIEAVKMYELESDDYAVMTGKKIAAEGANYDIQAYDVDPDTGVASLVILRGERETEFSSENAVGSVCIFDKTSSVYDVAKEKAVTKVYYYDKTGEPQTALVDEEDAVFSVRYKIFGKEKNVGETTQLKNGEIKKLQPGDLFSLKVDGDGYIKSIIRYVNLDIAKSDLCSFNGCNAPGLSQPYSNGSNGPSATTGERYTNQREFSYGYGLGVIYARKITGSVVRAVTSKGGNKTKFSTVDLSTPTKYAELFVNLGAAEPTVISFDDSGEMRVEQGTVNDIVTVEDVYDSEGKTYNLDKASMIIYTSTDTAVNSVFVINGYDNYLRNIHKYQ